MSNNAYLHATSTKWVLSLAVLGALGACGGGGGSSPTVAATSNVTVAASSAVVSALVPAAGAAPIQASFSNGFSGTDGSTPPVAVAVTGPTTVAFTSSGATPGFSITNGGLTATGVTTFGSCIFTMASTSPFPSGSPFAAGKVFKVNPCEVKVSTTGGVANGTSVARDVSLWLSGGTSLAMPLPVVISSTGVVAVNGVTVGTVGVGPTTGAGS